MLRLGELLERMDKYLGNAAAARAKGDYAESEDWLAETHRTAVLVSAQTGSLQIFAATQTDAVQAACNEMVDAILKAMEAIYEVHDFGLGTDKKAKCRNPKCDGRATEDTSVGPLCKACYDAYMLGLEVGRFAMGGRAAGADPAAVRYPGWTGS